MGILISATFWSSIQRFGGLIISFISNIVLARLLCPEDYGIVGLIMVFIGIADVLVDGGLGNALIQKKEIDREDISTVFTTNLFLSLVLFLLLFFLAPFVESYVKIKGFSLFLRIESVMVLLKAMYVVHFSILNREMNFKKIALISLIASLASTIIAVSMAFSGFGVWSLITRNITIDLVTLLLLFVFCKIEFSLHISKSHFKSLFNYGFFVAIANVAESLYANILSFVLGKRFSVKELGYYNQASSLEQIPVFSVTSVLNQVLFPFLSKEQDNKIKMGIDIEKSLQVMSFLMYPLMTFLICFAEPIIVLLYSEKWLPSVHFFQILCIIGYINFIYHINRSVLKAVGKAKVLFYSQIGVCVIGLLLLLVSVNWGVFYVVYSVSISSILSMIMVSIIASPYIGLSIWGQLKNVVVNLIISLIIGAILYWLFSFVDLSPIILIPIALLSYALFYLIVHSLIRSQSYILVKAIVLPYLKQKGIINPK